MMNQKKADREANWRRTNQEKESRKKVDCSGCIERIEAEAESTTEAQKAESRRYKKEAVSRKRIES